MSEQKLNKKSSVSRCRVQSKVPKLSMKDKVIKLYEEGLTAPQIFKIVGCSESYAHRLVKKLRLVQPINNIGQFAGGTTEQTEQINVHAHNIVAHVFWMSDFYSKNPQQNLKEFVPDVDVYCKGKRINIVSRVRFTGITEEKAMWKSINFWERILLKLERQLGVVIFKRGHTAWEFRKEETETTDSVFCKDAESRGDIVRVFHTEDGKLRLTTDRSNKTPNHETHHSRDGHVDSITFNAHINSILDNPSAPVYDELVKLVAANIKISEENGLYIKDTVANLNSLLKLIVDDRRADKVKSEVDVSVVDLPAPDYFG